MSAYSEARDRLERATKAPGAIVREGLALSAADTKLLFDSACDLLALETDAVREALERVKRKARRSGDRRYVAIDAIFDAELARLRKGTA